MSRPLSEVLGVCRLLVGVCGSVGAVHLPAILVHLKATLPELEVAVVMTERATEFVPASVLALLTGRPAVVGTEWGFDGSVAHLDLTRWAELFVVLPATANVLGKAAHGIADDALTTSILAATCPVVFVPSMNVRMWESRVVRRNVVQLREDGAWVIDPVDGLQASTGGVASGSLPPLDHLLTELTIITQNHRSRV